MASGSKAVSTPTIRPNSTLPELAGHVRHASELLRKVVLSSAHELTSL